MTALDALLDATLVGYTRLGYAARGLRPPTERGYVEGRHVVVTGATSGLGRATALSLAGLGARLTLIGRSRDKLEDVRQAALATNPGAELTLEVADLALMREVDALATRLLAKGDPIHVLVNDAGVLLPAREVTAEGVERTHATNLLGHYLLTERLVPALRAAAPSRVINVSSGGMYTARIAPDDLETERLRYEGASAYARTKRAQVILTELWDARLRDAGVTVVSMHPGWADTAGVQRSLPTFHKVTRAVLRDADQGADTIIWLATTTAPLEGGRFYHDRRPVPTHRAARTKESEADRRALCAALDARLDGLLDRGFVGPAYVAARTGSSR